MRFYELKYEVTDNKWKEMIRKDRDAVQDWCYRVKDITEEYNDGTDKTEKYYLYDFSPSDVSIAYVLDGKDNDREGLKKYLDAIGLQGKAYEPCEIKFESFRRYLRIGERRDILDEDDELVKIAHRSIAALIGAVAYHVGHKNIEAVFRINLGVVCHSARVR